MYAATLSRFISTALIADNAIFVLSAVPVGVPLDIV